MTVRVTAFERLAAQITALQRASYSEQRRATELGVQRTLAASQRVPLYREKYAAAGVDLAQIVGAEDLWRLPAVSKADFTARDPRYYVDERLNPLQLRHTTTSGSLGAPLTLYSTDAELAQLTVYLHSPWLEQSVGRNDRALMLLAPYLEQAPPHWQTRWVPASVGHDGVVRAFSELQPTVIIGSTEAIALLGLEVARRTDLQPLAARVRALFPFGQTLSAELRTMMQGGFRAPIYDLYGSQEAGWLGVECEASRGLHVPAGQVVVQIARLGQPDVPAAVGELGEVIVTSLLRTTTPMIRYRLHDVAVLDESPCDCGRNTPRITAVEGRVQDFLVSATGRLVSPGNVCSDLSKLPRVLDHRVVQESLERVRIQLVMQGELQPADRDAVRAAVQLHLGKLSVQVQQVHEIERDPSGKRRRAHRAFPLPTQLRL
jgi:phenylacetate-CoA ligase